MGTQSEPRRHRRWSLLTFVIVSALSLFARPAWALCYNCLDVGGGCYACVGQPPQQGDLIFCTNGCGGGYCNVSGQCGIGLSSDIGRDGAISQRSIRAVGLNTDRIGLGRSVLGIFANLNEARWVVAQHGLVRNCRGNIIQRFFGEADADRVRRETSVLTV